MDYTKTVVNKYKKLQTHICKEIETLDGKAKFFEDNWESKLGSGITNVISKGDKIEKGAVNFSFVNGKFTEKMHKILGESADEFVATGVSSIFHPYNPYSPIIHMNIRYFELDNGTKWFGGGIDLTPHYVIPELARDFHLDIKKKCDKYSDKFYPEFKKWCDDYFFLQHRNESRGIGGIFFDRVKPGSELDFEDLFAFTIDLAELYPKLYAHQINSSHNLSYGENEKKWQNIRRSRYVEYNLLFDRGTKFGIESGGRAESILVSMPPMAEWYYDFQPKEGSREHETQIYLSKGIEWVEK